MTTTTLEPASSDIFKILRETRSIWSGGLTPSNYITYMQEQLTYPWAKKHLKYLLLRVGDEIAASLKYYTLTFTSRGRACTLAGLGAIYTMEKFRGQGFATEIISNAIELAKKSDMAGVLLFSDIDPSFYERFDFVDLGAYNFEQIAVPSNVSGCLPFVSKLSAKHIPSLESTYSRWVRRQPFGTLRSHSLWSYKIRRGDFVQGQVPLEWPEQRLITTSSPDETFQGYAIIESSKKIMRVLELIGTEESQSKLWQQILCLAQQAGCQRIRGWEGTLPSAVSYAVPYKDRVYVEREWGRPMLLPLSKNIEPWIEADPCPLLERDHF